MFSRFVRTLSVVALCALPAACVSGGETPLASPVQGGGQTRMALAFEPLVGIPEERAAVLAEELGTGAIARGIDVVPRSAGDDSYRVRGYLSASGSGAETSVRYVWDIFDADGGRVHRVSGTDTVSAALPDPWQAVTDDALRRIARQTVDGLGSWIEQGAPVTETQPVPQATGAGDAGAATALVAGMPPIPADAMGGPLVAADSGFQFHVDPVAGAIGDGSASLSAALRDRLSAAGGSPVRSLEDADFRVSGQTTVGPEQGGVQTVAIIWSVARASGEVIGTVRQVANVAANQLDAAWGTSAERAAAAAAPGVLDLISGG